MMIKGKDRYFKELPSSEIVGDKVPEGETSKRSRRPTDKGKQFEIDKCLKSYAKYIRLLKRSLKDLDLEVTAATETKSIKAAVKAANATLGSLEDAFIGLRKLLDFSDLKPYEEEFNRFENQRNEQVSLAIEVLRTLIDRRSDVSSCSSKSNRRAQIKGPSTTHSTPSNLSGYASRSRQDKRLQKMEKVAALKTQLSCHAKQSKLRERRATLEEEEQ